MVRKSSQADTEQRLTSYSYLYHTKCLVGWPYRPLLVTATTSPTLDVAVYYADPQGLYWNISRDWAQGAQNTTTNSFGGFSLLPVYPLGGRIMGTASVASRSNSTAPQIHPKYHNTRYAYQSRSYGVGSSVGIVWDVLSLPNLARYNYSEIGYKAGVTFEINHTSLWTIQWVS
jgi:hypothetical protein